MNKFNKELPAPQWAWAHTGPVSAAQSASHPWNNFDYEIAGSDDKTLLQTIDIFICFNLTSTGHSL
jgi:hypothetical protein